MRYACPNVTKYQGDQFFMSTYIFIHQFFYIHVKFLHICFETIYPLSMQLLLNQAIFSMVVVKNCHAKIRAHSCTSRKPGDELLIDRSFA